MGYIKETWVDRNVQYPHTYTDAGMTSYLFTAAPGTITAAGTNVTATRMNKLESGVYDASPPGEVKGFARKKPPTNYLVADGVAVSRATYADLFDAICPAETFTVTIASPAIFTVSGGHYLEYGDPIRLTTTGALPTGLAAGVTYYVISAGLSTTQFEVSTSVGGAVVNTSGSQSGTHTLRSYNHGVGDGSTTFNLPDYRGVALRGLDGAASGAAARGLDVNRVLGSYQDSDNKTHTHTNTVGTESATHTHTQAGGALITGSGGSGASGLLPAYYGSPALAYYGGTNTESATHNHTVTINATGDANEVKVRNVSVLYCIRY